MKNSKIKSVLSKESQDFISDKNYYFKMKLDSGEFFINKKDEFGRPFLNTITDIIFETVDSCILDNYEKNIENFIRLVSECLELGYDLESKDKIGLSLLNLWCRSTNPGGYNEKAQELNQKAISFLIEKGASINTENKHGLSAFSYVLDRNAQYMFIFLKAGVLVKPFEKEMLDKWSFEEDWQLTHFRKIAVKNWMEWKVYQDKKCLEEIIPQSKKQFSLSRL